MPIKDIITLAARFWKTVIPKPTFCLNPATLPLQYQNEKSVLAFRKISVTIHRTKKRNGLVGLPATAGIESRDTIKVRDVYGPINTNRDFVDVPV